MTKLEKAIAALFKTGWGIAEIVKEVGVDAKQIEVAIRLKLNDK